MIDTALIFATACDFGWRVNSNPAESVMKPAHGSPLWIFTEKCRIKITIQHPRLGTLRVPRCGRTEQLRCLSAPRKTSETVRRASSPSGFHQFSKGC